MKAITLALALGLAVVARAEEPPITKPLDGANAVRNPVSVPLSEGSPVGLARVGHLMQGIATAVTWFGDYVYVAALAVLQVYRAAPGEAPVLVREIELRDWGREMAVDNGTLFVAARGDGLYAFDLSGDPANPRLAGQVGGVLNVGGHTDVEAMFNGVDARHGRVALARANMVTKGQGGVDALVYDYEPASGRFTPVRAVGTEARSHSWLPEVPVTVGLTEDGQGLFIGYGVLVGELAYVPLAAPGGPILHKTLGGVMDIKTKGDVAFVAITTLGLPLTQVSMLSRVRVANGELVDEPIITKSSAAAGGSVDIHGDCLAFATWGVQRYDSEPHNLWLFTNLLAKTPTRVAAAGTMDWVYQLACRAVDAETGWVYVADEWGGLELWKRTGNRLTLDLAHHRVPTGMCSLSMWTDGAKIFSVKQGAGLWGGDEAQPGGARPVVEWLNVNDPGFRRPDSRCPPFNSAWDYPPAVFVSAGASTRGRVVVLAQDRNIAVPGTGYLMMFEEQGGRYVNIYAEPVKTWSGNLIKTVGNLIFATNAPHALRVYQHDPAAANPLRPLGDIPMPARTADWAFADAAVHGDYMFVAVLHYPFMGEPEYGAIHVYRWKQGPLPAGAPLPASQYLGTFCSDLIPDRLVLDAANDRLLVGCAAHAVFPIRAGALLVYDLTAFNPAKPDELDKRRVAITAADALRVKPANIQGLCLDGDSLFVADRDNGLYEYTFCDKAYRRFYPAHRGSMSHFFLPQRVQSPPGLVPLYCPVAVARLPSGRLAVQEGLSGRVSLLEVLPVPPPPRQPATN